MNSGSYHLPLVLVIILAIVFVALLATAVVLIVGYYRRCRETVAEESQRLKSLKQYNHQWSFYSLPEIVQLSVNTTERRAEVVLIQAVRENTVLLSDACEYADTNRKNYSRYINGIDGSVLDTSLEIIKHNHIPIWLFHHFEKELCQKVYLSPRIYFKLKVKANHPSDGQEVEPRIFFYSLPQLEFELSIHFFGIVENNSEKLKELIHLNNETTPKFEKLLPEYKYNKRCTSVSEFEKYQNSDMYLDELLYELLAVFKERFHLADTNSVIFKTYCEACSQIPPTNPGFVKQFNMPVEAFYQRENILFEAKELQPPISSFTCKISITYSDQQGNCKRSWEHLYSYKEIKNHFLLVQENRQNLIILKLIEKHSEKLKNLIALNNKTISKYENLSSEYKYTKNCDSSFEF